MSERSEEQTRSKALREKIIGLGERSIRKSYYPKLQEHIAELVRFRALLDQSTDAIILMQAPSGRLVDVNESACKQLGFSREELLKLTVEALWPHSISELVLRLFHGEETIRNPQTLELEMRTSKGERFPAEVTFRRVHFNNADYVVAVARDVTDRNLAEEKYRSIFENVVEGVFQATQSGRVLSANPALARIFGYDTPTEFMESVTDIGSQICVDPERREQLLRMAQGSSAVAKFEAQMYRRDGSLLWASINARPRYDRHAEILLIEGTLEDITERKLAEEALREGEERYRTLVEACPLGIAFYDWSGTIIEVNPALLSIMGSPSAEATKTINLFTFPPLVEAGVSSALRQCLDSGEPVVGEFPYISKWDREIHMRLHVTSMRDAEGNVIGGQVLVEDITESKHLEEQVRQKAKLEAIGQLAGGVAHDFNNLLTAVLGYSKMLQQQLPADNECQDKLAQISQAAERATSLTGQLLAFGRKQMLDVRPLNLNDAVSRFGQMLRRLIGEDIEVVTVAAPDLRNISADAGQIEQILMNLAVNARDSMPTGGALTIESANVALDEEYCRNHTDVTPGMYVMLAVSDTGKGMDTETLARVFEPFFTTKAKGSGTGLGMSTVYGVVKQHQGHISVYSELGTGTTFKIYFPQLDRPVETESLPSRPKPERKGHETVLVVEDEEVVRDLACEALELLGYSPMPARDPVEAVSMCQQFKGEIHLLLTDVVLPQMDGRSLFRLLSEIRPGMKVLYVSGYTENFIVRHGVLDPGVHFLPKPFTMDSLADKVGEVLAELRD
jgi:two-component system cell cycle sensor histidine kinase/response regulator CckA